MTCGAYGYMPPSGMGWEDPQDAYDIDSVGKGGGKGFGKGKVKGDGSCHMCRQFWHWSRECPSNPKGGGKGKGFGKGWQGPSQFGNGKGNGLMVKVGGTKVHVSTAIKLDLKQQNARMRGLLRFLRLGQNSRLVVLR